MVSNIRTTSTLTCQQWRRYCYRRPRSLSRILRTSFECFSVVGVRRDKRVDTGFSVTHAGKMSGLRIAAEPRFSRSAQRSPSAAVSGRKQMRPDKGRGCHAVRVVFCVSACFPIVNTVRVSHTSSCFPVPFGLWDNWLGRSQRPGLVSGRPWATASDRSGPLHRRKTEVNHSCLFPRLRRPPGSPGRAVPCRAKRGHPEKASAARRVDGSDVWHTV